MMPGMKSMQSDVKVHILRTIALASLAQKTSEGLVGQNILFSPIREEPQQSRTNGKLALATLIPST